MKIFSIRKVALNAALVMAVVFSSSYVYAACEVDAPAKRTTINILSNSFPSVNHLADEMKACAKGSLRVRAKLTTEHLELKRLALSSSGRSPYQIVQLSNRDATGYVEKGWLAPITEYVNKYRSTYNFDDIPQSMWDAFTVDGEIYGIPVQQNLQHFFYREDLFAKHKIAVPKNYRDVVKAAAKLKRKEPSIEYPIAQAFGRGWNLATEFTNIYMSLGGKFVDENNNPVFHTDKAGAEAIKTMSAMLRYMSPNALSFSTDDTMVAFQQGKSAMGNVWATRAGNMDDSDVSQVVGLVQYAAAPAAKRGRAPSSTGWWDGYAIPANVPADERELAFQIMASATDAESMIKGGALAFYSRAEVTTQPDLVEKNRYWPAMLETAKRGVPPFPGEPYFGIAHTALGTNVADALAGTVSAKEALAKAAAEYIQEATAKGFIN